MSNPNILDAEVRKQIINDIKSSENVARKRNEQRKFDIYRKRQALYVLERLTSEFDPKTVKGMRKILSINPCKRIVDEQASLYVDEPDRHWTNAENNEQLLEQLKNLYSLGKIDPQFRLANRYFKLHGQSCLYVLPKKGKIIARALTPKDYDVIPDADDPEQAFAYVLNIFDANLHKTTPSPTLENSSASSYNVNDNRNQLIADANDPKLANERYVFWSAEVHLTCDGRGEIVDGLLEQNPIERLPFIDLANEKDFQFFVQLGSDVAEFVIDLLLQLSDLANTVKFQNYSQAVISSPNQPVGLNIGPDKVLWLQTDPNSDAPPPNFEFVSPSPDIMGTLELVNVMLKMFLSSHGLNPGTVSGKNELEKFTSGIDHLLANLDKFKASKEDMDVFRAAEQEMFEIMRAWHTVLFNVTDEMALNDELKLSVIPEDVQLDVAFKEPQAVQTQTETEDSCLKLVQAGLMTKCEAVKRIYGVDDEKAEEMVAELEMERQQRIQENAERGLDENGKPLAPQVDENGDPVKPGVVDVSGEKPFGDDEKAEEKPKPADKKAKGKKIPPKKGKSA